MVVGFRFSPDLQTVCLIEKLKPDWMAGKLNGVGGKVEPGESAGEAMRREFREEAGLDEPDWRPFASISGHRPGADYDFVIESFYSIGSLLECRQMESEKVLIVPTSAVLLGEVETMGNLPLQVAMVLGIIRGRDQTSAYAIYEVNQ